MDQWKVSGGSLKENATMENDLPAENLLLK
jgi:hypothetical protein